EVLDYYEFRLLPDFSNKQSATATQATTVIQDAYLNCHWWDCFQLETGKYKQPVSFEELIQDRYFPFCEKSMTDQLVPQREIGVMVHGEFLLKDRLDYAVAFYNGETAADFDTNDRKDWAGRVVF